MNLTNTDHITSHPITQPILQTNIDKIASLNHKVLNHSMKLCIFVANWNTISAIFASAKLSKRNGGSKVDCQLKNYVEPLPITRYTHYLQDIDIKHYFTQQNNAYFSQHFLQT